MNFRTVMQITDYSVEYKMLDIVQIIYT